MAPDSIETMTFEDFKNRLAHAYVAYRYFAQSLPPQAALNVGTVRVGQFEFSKSSQLESMIGRARLAFFVRFDAVLEAFLETCSVTTGGQKLFERMEATKKFTEHELEGLRQYRDLRNSLHHDDGQPTAKRKFLSVSEGREPQFDVAHMGAWQELFLKIGRVAADGATTDDR